MLRKLFQNSLVLIAVISLAGCSSVTIVSDVTTFHNFGATTQFSGSIFVKAESDTPVDNLEFQTYASQIMSDFEKYGFSQAGSEASARYVATFGYSINGGQPYQYTTPIISQTGGGTTYEQGTVYGNSGSASYSGTSYTPPTFDVTGAVNHTGTVYTRLVTIKLIDKASGKVVWEGNNRSKGVADDIRAVLPAMIHALLKDFPGQSGKTTIVHTSKDFKN
jgi:hypothetical protein